MAAAGKPDGALATAVNAVVGALDVRAAFARADTDASGTLTKVELSAALKAANVHVGEREVDEIFDSLDADGSGAIDAKELDAAFYAARLSGGIHVYVPCKPEQHAYFESADFKQKLLHGWRK